MTNRGAVISAIVIFGHNLAMTTTGGVALRNARSRERPAELLSAMPGRENEVALSHGRENDRRSCSKPRQVERHELVGYTEIASRHLGIGCIGD